MTNIEIIQTEAILKNFTWNGKNLFTYHEWKNRGYQVQKGEKAFIKTKLWKYVTKIDKKTGEEKINTYMVKASLFTSDQVKEIEINEVLTAITV